MCQCQQPYPSPHHQNYLHPAQGSLVHGWFPWVTLAGSATTLLLLLAILMLLTVRPRLVPGTPSSPTPTAPTVTAPAPPQPLTVKAATLQNVHMRSRPGPTSPSLGVLPANTLVTIIGCATIQCNWYQLDTGGWVAAPFLRICLPVVTPPTPVATTAARER